MKTYTIAKLSDLKVVLFLALVEILFLLPTLMFTALLSGCIQSTTNSEQPGSKHLQSVEVLHREVSAVLNLELPRDRYAGLLRLHLQYPRALPPVVYLAQIDSAAGDTSVAEVWLQAARDSEVGEVAPDSARAYETQLMWYLSARSAYEQWDHLKCLSYLEQMKGGVEGEEKGGTAPELASNDYTRMTELFKHARLLKVKAMMRGHINSTGGDPKTVCDLLSLVLESSPELLTNEVLLQGSDICSTENRFATASDLLQHYCRRRPFNPDYREIAAKLCKVCGLDVEADLIRHEAAAFSQLGQEAPGNFSGADEKLLEAVHRFQSNQWEEAFELLQTLIDEGKLPRHRFVEYMYASSRLYSRPRERDARENYTRLAELYGDQQLYFVHLYRALYPLGDSDAQDSSDLKLVEQALRGCIAAGPHTEWAGEARAHLAQLAGLAPELKVEPLLKEEMQQLAGFVWEGGSPQLLQPLITALEWPENCYTLEAGLLLRKLRVIPGVDAYITRKQKVAGERGQERMRAILQF